MEPITPNYQPLWSQTFASLCARIALAKDYLELEDVKRLCMDAYNGKQLMQGELKKA